MAGRRVGLFVAGGIPAVIGLAAYQWAAFGNPLSFSYARSSFGEAARRGGNVDQDPALLENALRVLVGERGSSVVTPILVLATLGAIQPSAPADHDGAPTSRRSPARPRSSRADGVVEPAPEATPPGPRYATATAAFLAPGLAHRVGPWPRATKITAVLGGLIMLAATWSNPLEARDSTSVIGIWFDHIASGDWALTVYEMALGGWAVVLLPLVAAVAVAASSGRAGATATIASPPEPRRERGATIPTGRPSRGPRSSGGAARPRRSRCCSSRAARCGAAASRSSCSSATKVPGSR